MHIRISPECKLSVRKLHEPDGECGCVLWVCDQPPCSWIIQAAEGIFCVWVFAPTQLCATRCYRATLFLLATALERLLDLMKLLAILILQRYSQLNTSWTGMWCKKFQRKVTLLNYYSLEIFVKIKGLFAQDLLIKYKALLHECWHWQISLFDI